MPHSPARNEVDVAPADGPAYGYWGRPVDPADRADLTLSGQLGVPPPNIADTPTSTQVTSAHKPGKPRARRR